MNDQKTDKLANYMQDPSIGLGLKYIQTRASSVPRYLLERNIQLLFSWIPGPVGLVMRALLYRPFLHSGSHMPFIEASTELFYMNQIRFGKGVYVDRYCRLHASTATIALGNNTRVIKGAYLSTYISSATQGEGIATGANCWIGANSSLGAGQGGLFIGDNVLIGPNTVIVTGGHDYQRIDLTAIEQNFKGTPIHIQDNVWIGSSVVILGGVTIGEHSVIAAGAVVTKNVAPYTVFGSEAGRTIRQIKKK